MWKLTLQPWFSTCMNLKLASQLWLSIHTDVKTNITAMVQYVYELETGVPTVAKRLY